MSAKARASLFLPSAGNQRSPDFFEKLERFVWIVEGTLFHGPGRLASGREVTRHSSAALARGRRP